jgi:hypothetical protein
MRSRCMSLLPRTTLHSDSEHYFPTIIRACPIIKLYLLKANLYLLISNLYLPTVHQTCLQLACNYLLLNLTCTCLGGDQYLLSTDLYRYTSGLCLYTVHKVSTYYY